MGSNMARRLRDKGYCVKTVYDFHKEGSESLSKELACEFVSSSPRVGELCEVVLTVVTDDKTMNEIFSENSYTSLIIHAKDKLFINFATVSPKAHIKTEDRVNRNGGANLGALIARQYNSSAQGYSLSYVWRQEAKL